MFQTHCYDSWLRPELHQLQLDVPSQLGGLPAPLFIFLAGVSFALVTEKLRVKGMGRWTLRKKTTFAAVRRSLPWESCSAYRNTRRTNGRRGQTCFASMCSIFWVLSMIILMGVLCGSLRRQRFLWRGNVGSFSGPCCVAMAIALVTPPLWRTGGQSFCLGRLKLTSTVRIRITSRSTGCSPSSRWCAFAFTGLAVGFLAFSHFARKREALFFGLLGLGEITAILLSMLFDALPVRLDAVTITGIRAPISFWRAVECC